MSRIAIFLYGSGTALASSESDVRTRNTAERLATEGERHVSR